MKLFRSFMLTVEVLNLVACLAIAGDFLYNRPCSTEDSTWCSWEAQSYGNRQGRSFIALWEGVAIYLPE